VSDDHDYFAERMDRIEALLERIAKAVENPMLAVDMRTGEVKSMTNPHNYKDAWMDPGIRNSPHTP
jgi:hypothetical protein